MSTIRYFIPEDGDSELHPNVFLAPKPRQPNQPPLLRDIKSAFPLQGTFHFRFKSALIPGAEQYGKGNDIAVWMDCVDANRPVPVWRNTIIAKVTRISMDEDDEEGFEDGYGASNGNVVNGTKAHTKAPAYHAPSHPIAPTRPTPPPPPPASENLLNVFDEPTPVASPSPAAAPTNLFDMDHPTTTNPAASNHTSSSTESLLNMDTPATTAAPAASNLHSDFLGMSMDAPAQQPPPPQHHFPQQPVPQQQQHHHIPQQTAQQQQQHYQSPHGVRPNPGMTGMNMNGNAGMAQRPTNGYGSNSRSKKENGFDSFANKQGPFGNLNW